MTTIGQRLEMFAELGVDQVALLDFDDALRRLSPEDFVTHVLGDALQLVVLVERQKRPQRERAPASVGALGVAVRRLDPTALRSKLDTATQRAAATPSPEADVRRTRRISHVFHVRS